MRITVNRRTATALGLAAATASMIALGAGPASADAVTWLDTSHGAGVYNQPYTADGKTGAPDLFASDGDGVQVMCWVRGDNINNQGNVWYYIDQAYYSWSGWVYEAGYVYGAYVDNNALFHSGAIAHCSWGA